MKLTEELQRSKQNFHDARNLAEEAWERLKWQY